MSAPGLDEGSARVTFAHAPLGALALPWSRVAVASTTRAHLHLVPLESSGRLRALGVATVCADLRAGDYVGGRVGAAFNWCAAHLGLFRYRVAFLELPWTNHPGLLFAADAGPDERALLE